ncbi:MAG TPA: phage holin family protein [Chthonomonadaceae bacterium]|nr:phage holin family protein [Chthonomonadaceae bacterium]
MRNWILRWIASTVALLILTLVLPQFGLGIHLDTAHPLMLVVGVLALGLANTIIRPIIMFFVWPINCLTFGLLGFVINALLFWLVGNADMFYKGLSLGFRVDHTTSGFYAALIAPVAMGIISGIINYLFKDRNDRDNQ